MAEKEFSIADMIDTAATQKPTEFGNMFSAQMANKIDQQIDQLRQDVLDDFNNIDVEDDGNDEQSDETDNDNEEVESDEDDEATDDGEDDED